MTPGAILRGGRLAEGLPAKTVAAMCGLTGDDAAFDIINFEDGVGLDDERGVYWVPGDSLLIRWARAVRADPVLVLLPRLTRLRDTIACLPELAEVAKRLDHALRMAVRPRLCPECHSTGGNCWPNERGAPDWYPCTTCRDPEPAP